MKVFSVLVIGCVLFLGLSCSVAKLEQTTPTTTVSTGKVTPSEYAEWTLNDLTITPSEAEVGEEVVVSVWINVYGAIGEPTGKMLLAIDGRIVATKDIWLTADFSELVSFTVVTNEVGAHEVRLAVMLDDETPYKFGVNDLAAKLVVRPIRE